MKSKAPLILMEQLVMLAVFALAAALCLQAFVKSDQLSRRAEAQDRAVALCQSAAEVIRANGGDLPAAAAALGLTYGAYAGESLDFEAHYNGDWTLSNTREYDYCLRAERVEAGIAGLGRAKIWVVKTADGSTVFELEAAWQEEVSARD